MNWSQKVEHCAVWLNYLQKQLYKLPDHIWLCPTIKVALHKINAKHAQFRVMPRYKVKAEGDQVGDIFVSCMSFE